MPLSLGGNSVRKIYLGSKEVKRIYLGTKLVYSSEVAWTPAELTTLAWYDAADASTITLNGSNVSQWDDKSGSGRHLSQVTASRQPSYAASTLNDRPLITLVDDFMTQSSHLQIGPGNNFSFAMVHIPKDILLNHIFRAQTASLNTQDTDYSFHNLPADHPYKLSAP